jgi:GTPase SAR1 family protein
LLKQWQDGVFIPTRMSTLGVEFGTKIVNVKDHLIKTQIWDTVRERFDVDPLTLYAGRARVLPSNHKTGVCSWLR